MLQLKHPHSLQSVSDVSQKPALPQPESRLSVTKAPLLVSSLNQNYTTDQKMPGRAKPLERNTSQSKNSHVPEDNNRRSLR